jgi:glycosyltransferase involved in cell wall biosynthesis
VSRCTLLVDARALDVSGLGRYLRELLCRLFRDPRFSHFILLGDPIRLREIAAHEGVDGRVTMHAYPCVFYHPKVQLRWLHLRVQGKCDADAYFFPHYDAPLVGLPPRSVVTVHDLTHLVIRAAFPWWRRLVAGRVLARVTARASWILTGSRHARADLLQRFPQVQGRIECIPHGVDPFWFTAPEPVAGAGSPATAPPFLVCVGNRKPHKNLVVAVEALARLRVKWPELRLVLVGRRFGDEDGVRRRAERLGVGERVIELCGVDDDGLKRLYATCEGLVIPSLYEGFGLPVLEAMACGAPVIASNRTALPEVVGDAGLLVEPTDAGEVAAAVLRLRDDAALRARLREEGRERARHFTWDEAAQRTADALLRVTGRVGVREAAQAEAEPPMAHSHPASNDHAS